jgi:hypothetical protein
MQIEGADVPSFKIGWAFDFEHRQRQFNQAAMPEIGGLSYKTCLSKLWPTAKKAYAVEQYLLEKKFKSKRHPRNQEIVSGLSFEELKAVWDECIKSHEQE